MHKSLKSILLFLFGFGLVSAAIISYVILLEGHFVNWILLSLGLIVMFFGGTRLKGQIVGFFRAQRVDILISTVGTLGVIFALAYLSNHFSVRIDMTKEGTFSLSKQTIEMLRRLQKPVHITFFHDPLMRDTDDIYRLMSSYTDKVTIEFLDPMVNPAKARMKGIEFAGTALMESEDRTLKVNGPTEVDIANGILRVSQQREQILCFLEGHSESDPFSLEHHDHFEGDQDHTHGLDTKVVVHERHGMAKARNSLESMNYTVKTVRLLDSQSDGLAGCDVFVVAGPQTELRKNELKIINKFIKDGGNALFMLDPFVRTGLESIIENLGVKLDDTVIIDEASHFWTDVSAPAVTNYNRHAITEGLPLTFFMGVRSLSPTDNPVPGHAVKPLINSSKRSFAETDSKEINFDLGSDIAGPNTIMAVVVRSPNFVDPTTLTVPTEPKSGNKVIKDKSRIAIIGDSDFATNSFFHILGNGNLFLNTVNYLASQENLIGIEPKTYDLPRVNLTNRQMKATFFLSMILVPGLLALIGVAVWWRQR